MRSTPPNMTEEKFNCSKHISPARMFGIENKMSKIVFQTFSLESTLNGSVFWLGGYNRFYER